ncbi:hypothetical protein HHO41_13325 [Bacillus sp. DNRA2]|uniref:hypothetical protein n=1 Tax=Bacillus sp. DNRA2 TaxID=2723053 RepID=UPI00145F5728|nr:hypothetical protein [Bacillus sp. DNRA2]NMD71279.1 hypothetical protein [Bacillus sp. DNRA2]
MEYIDRLEQDLFLAAYWEQSGFKKSGLSFEELLDNKLVCLALLPNEPKEEYLKDKLISIRKALEKGMDDEAIIYILNLEIEQ